MKNIDKDKLLVGIVLGAMLIITLTVVGMAFFPFSKKAQPELTLSPSPEVVKLVPSPSSIALFVPSPTPSSVLATKLPTPKPSATPVASASATATPKPSPSPTPTSSPSPTPAPAADLLVADPLYFTSSASWSTNIFNDHNIKRPSSETFSVNIVEVRNNGKVQTEKIEIRFVIDGVNQSILTLDEKVDPGTTNHFAANKALPNSVGHHTVQIQLNPDKKITESEYGNNGASFEYTVE